MKISNKMKKLKKYFKYSLFNYELFLLKLVLVNLVDIKLKRKLVLYSSTIHITIQGKGNQRLLGYDFAINPSDVIVKGVSKISSCSKTCILEDIKSNITLIFDNQIESFSSLFEDVRNVTFVDLSNFDTSKVTDFHWMFSGCRNLEKINFGNIKTSLVENMSSLFYHCSKLTSIDLSNFDTS